MRSLTLPLLLLAMLAPAASPPGKKPAAPSRRATFSFVCATQGVLFPPQVKKITAGLARAHRSDGSRAWGDRAVALRLRRDDPPTYFVPLACGATGNCTWGIVATTPARSMGVVSGAVLSVETGGTGWPAIQVYSSGQNRVETLQIDKGQYRSRPAKPPNGTTERLQSCLDSASCCPHQSP